MWVSGDALRPAFYYIADEGSFEQLIKFCGRIPHRINETDRSHQEAGLIGGIGVCAELSAAPHMADFKSITTQAARCRDLALNPQLTRTVQ